MLRPVANNRLCYIHVYKCGGTSMRNFNTENIDLTNTIFIDQWVYDWERTNTRTDRLLGNITRAEYLRYLSSQWDKSDNVIVLTHSFFYSFMKRWPDFSFATMLRDPIKRVVSQFFF